MTMFSTVLSDENMVILFVKIYMLKIASQFGTGNPSLTKFHGNLRNKIITHYELRITH